MPRITLQSNNGFGWSIGTAKSKLIDLVSGKGFGWRAVVPVLPTNTTPPSIAGTAQVGQVLTANPGVWTGSPALTYQWQANSVNISGATGSTYTPVVGQVGQAIRVVVTGTTSRGAVSANSAPTATVIAA